MFIFIFLNSFSWIFSMDLLTPLEAPWGSLDDHLKTLNLLNQNDAWKAESDITSLILTFISIHLDDIMLQSLNAYMHFCLQNDHF